MGTFQRAVVILKEEAGRVPLPPGQVVGLVLDYVLERLHGTPVPRARGLQKVVGTGLILAGMVMTAWAVVERRQHTVGSFALGRPETLVTSGPYAVSRHPMYLGWWMIHAGVAILNGSYWALATLPAGVLVEHLGALWEEKMLQQEFGEPYLEYMKDVPRYVGIPRHRE
ncbi:methyltransferase family protein [Paenarthrobacter sp. NPDC057355]|uniref:methyltransferase family protein n=1 Tax=Paenarthrobacter sp. NPDC057355 TaxID=3346105 RepID=UPI0036333907